MLSHPKTGATVPEAKRAAASPAERHASLMPDGQSAVWLASPHRGMQMACARP